MIPAFFISLFTFPGIIVHEMAHQFFCRLFKVPIFEVCYFQTKNPMGYVVHEPAKFDYQNILISVGPFIINSVLCFVIGISAALQFKFESANIIDYFLMYLAISIGTHAFPSIGDAKSLWEIVVNNQKKSRITNVIVGPIVGLIYIGAIGSVFWLDVIYASFLGLGLPYIIIKFLA